MLPHVLAVLDAVLAPQHQIPAVRKTQLQGLLQHLKFSCSHKNRTPELSGRKEAEGIGPQSPLDQ